MVKKRQEPVCPECGSQSWESDCYEMPTVQCSDCQTKYNIRTGARV